MIREKSSAPPEKDIPPEGKSILLVILITLLVSILFYQTGKPFQIKKHVPIFNFDTFVYAQYARAWADGHPYRFNAQDPPTTGCTSHLYPFLLSLFYRMGSTGIHLVDMAFGFNLLLLVFSGILFFKIMGRLLPAYGLLATGLFLVNGQLLLGILGLSEAGLFLFFSLALWWGILSRRYWMAGISLFLLPFIRPEGVIIIAIYGGLLIARKLWLPAPPSGEEKGGRDWLLLATGLLAAGLLFLLNYLLTGMLAFDSIIKKSHFLNNHWLTSLDLWVHSIVTNFKTLLLGEGDTIRLFYLMPLFSGVLIVIGFFKLPWNKKEILNRSNSLQLWWFLFFLASLVMTSNNRALMLHYDRYLVWVLPLLIPFLIRGIDSLSPVSRTAKGLILIFLFYQLLCLPVFLKSYAGDCGKFRAILAELRQPQPPVDEDGRIGVFAGSGIKYFHPRWHIINMGGVTSPFFRDCVSDAQRIKLIQYRPDLQFEHLMYFSGISHKMTRPSRPVYTQPLVEKVLLPTEITFYLDRIDWDHLLLGIMPRSAEIRRILEGMRLLDKLDIGYLPDTGRCEYRIHSQYPYTRSYPYLTKVEVNGQPFLDAAAGVLGSDRFTLKSLPQKPHWLVGRILLSDQVLLQDLEGIHKLGINTRQVSQLVLILDDRHQTIINLAPFIHDQNLVEWAVALPADFFSGSRTTFQILGDHIPCDYWLYSRP